MAENLEILKELAKTSWDGEKDNHEIEQFYLKYPNLNIHDGYRAQYIRYEMMLAEGFKPVGFKLGGTSLAKLKQVASELTSGSYVQKKAPTVGRLMDYMQIRDGEDLILDNYVHPKLEAELAFVLDKELYGPHITAPDVMMATAYVTPAFEIIDSRFKGFKMGGQADAIIDNVSSRGFKLGRVRKSPFEIDMIGMGVRTNFNWNITGFSASGAIMGHPARAVASLCHTMYEEWHTGIPAGSIILTGAICSSRALSKGDRVISDFEDLGSIWLDVK